MSNSISRRQFLWTPAVGAAGIAALLPGEARADYEQTIDFELTGEHDWDGYGRKKIVSQAMWIINRLFLDIETVAQNALNVAPDGWAVATMDTWNRLKPHYDGMKTGDHLLWYQLRTIRNWMAPPDPRNSPKLIIRSHYSEENVFAWANYNTVIVSGDGNNIEVTGNFDIWLNFYKLGAGGLDSDPWIWAAIIAHEMLHNLGHAHPEPVTDRRYQGRQINAFASALYYGGKYQMGMRTPDMRCGGRAPK